MGKRKSPRGALQLIRRHAHVEYDTVDAFMTVGAGDLIERRKSSFDECQAAMGSGPQGGAAGDSEWVAVDGNDLRALVQDGAGIATAAEGPVDEYPTGVGREKAHGLL